MQMYELITRIIVTINECACIYMNEYLHLFILCLVFTKKVKYCAMLQKGADASN